MKWKRHFNRYFSRPKTSPSIDTPSISARGLAEVVGTFIMVSAAAGSVMLVEMYSLPGSQILPALTAGFAVAIVVHVFGPVSGGHINPAVTLGMLMLRNIVLRDAVIYWLAQISAAVLSATVLRIGLGPAARLGGHYPSGSILGSILMEVLLTFALLTLIILVVSHQKRLGNISAVSIGTAIAVGILIGAPVSGGSMNPARSFGPTAISWSWSNHWVYWVGPLSGAILSVLNWLLTKYFINITILRRKNTNPDVQG